MCSCLNSRCRHRVCRVWLETLLGSVSRPAWRAVTPSASADRDVEPRRPLVRRSRRAPALTGRRHPAPHRGQRPPRLARLLDPPHVSTNGTAVVPGPPWPRAHRSLPAPIPTQPPPSRPQPVDLASSILPWRSCGTEPWGEGRHVDKTTRTLEALLARTPLPASDLGRRLEPRSEGREYAGSIGGRNALLYALTTLNLTATTTELPHRIEGLLSIDHIARSVRHRRVPSVGSMHRVCPTTTPMSSPHLTNQEAGHEFTKPGHNLWCEDEYAQERSSDKQAQPTRTLLPLRAAA